ncbi:MAG: UDP-N-acetylmuramoyl-L-alanyl-D-glutamate--2,6-diaminopimelate ligase [Armatimonadetes bacterium]|nr:UDP-N-acetylmuramoyl-L-alanyl-D-glutamate--2,6-diaminopimelate ligase [Armatimonadota bacterium]
MRLGALLQDLPAATVQGPTDVEVAGIAYHSGEVTPGALFAAVRGFVHDGHRFVLDAVARGAAAVMVEYPVEVPAHVSQVIVPDTRLGLALASAAFYGHPSRQVRVIGVTGTNGKGATTHLIEAVLARAGRPCGIIGTIGARVGDETLEMSRTTPEAPDLQRLLRAMADRGMRYAAVEVASHALALHRVAGCRFEAAVFTNLTQDHLDFHKTWEEYIAAKARLFAMVEPSGVAVINADDPHAGVMRAASRAPVIAYGIEQPAEIRARDLELALHGTSFVAVTPCGTVPVRLQLTGRFNVCNALAAVGIGISQGVDPSVIADALAAMPGIPGRFERVDRGEEFAVIVDYAHTPDGLENVLRTAADCTRGRTIVVFGCGGDRDRTKRPIMGRIAVELADHAIVTSDNPRTEEPMAIIEEIVAGIEALGRARRGTYEVEADRRKAIARAVALAQPGDVVLVAGKGHETYQEIKGRKYPFDDRAVARDALAARRAGTARSHGA